MSNDTLILAVAAAASWVTFGPWWAVLVTIAGSALVGFWQAALERSRRDQDR